MVKTDAGPDQQVGACDPVHLPPATFTDVGVLDTHTASIDWGDGTVETVSGNRVGKW